MDSGDSRAITLSGSPSSSCPSPAPSHTVVASPCAACKILRRRCAERCVLAPYFPPTDPLKFATAHRVFGASNIIKLLQELPESQRADAVSSMVYEANARIRDPVYGSAGAIFQLQKQLNDLQAQLAQTQAQLVSMQCQQANLLSLLCMDAGPTSPSPSTPDLAEPEPAGYPTNLNCFIDDTSLASMWELLWA
ncbi:hypothetical protein V2J09_020855 [Rumex salicifolius]